MAYTLPAKTAKSMPLKNLCKCSMRISTKHFTKGSYSKEQLTDKAID